MGDESPYPLTDEGSLCGCWGAVLDGLRPEVSTSAFRMWLEPLSVAPDSEGRIKVLCPSRLAQQRVKDEFAPRLTDLMSRSAGRPVELDLVVQPAPEAPLSLVTDRPAPTDRPRAGGPTSPVQLSLPRLGGSVIPLNPRFTFEEFVTGVNNEMAYAASRAIASRAGAFYAHIMCLTASTGLGKSHLAQAVANYLLQHGNGVQVRYTTTEDFTNEMVRSLKLGRIDEFKDKYRRGCDVLLLEGVSFLAGKPKVQTELAYTLDALFNADKRIVLTSSRPPKDIPKLDQDLSSRLSNGVVISIYPPDEATRGKILVHKARRAGLDLPSAVVAELAKGARGDVRQIESLIASLAARVQFQGRPVDLDLAREVLGQVCGQAGSLNVELIKSVVCRTFRLTEAELCSKSRYKRVVLPRNLAMYFTRHYTELSFAAIGQAFDREHATVMHSVKRIARQIKTDAKLAHQVRFLQDKLESEGQSNPPPA
jgi:chromosomal replication initiator protein